MNTDEEIAVDCQTAKKILAQGNIKQAVDQFLMCANDERAWEEDNLPNDDSFAHELCNRLKSKYRQLDYPIKLNLLWQRMLLNDDFVDVQAKLKELYLLLPNNNFVLISLAFCYEKLGLYRTCLEICKRIKQRCISSGFLGEDSETVDFTDYLIMDCLNELGEYAKLISFLDSLNDGSEYQTLMKIQALRSQRRLVEATEEASHYLEKYDSSDVLFYYGHLCYIQDHLDWGYESLFKLIEEHHKSEYVPFALVYIGRQEEAIKLARERTAKPSGKYILAEILSLTGHLEEAYHVLDDYLKAEIEYNKPRNTILTDPALQNLLLSGGGLEMVQEYIDEMQKKDCNEFGFYMNQQKTSLRGEVQLPFTYRDGLPYTSIRVWQINEVKAFISTASQRTILSMGLSDESAPRFVHRSRQFGELTVFEGTADIALGGWFIPNQPVLWCQDIPYNIIGADVLSKVQSIIFNNKLITIKI